LRVAIVDSPSQTAHPHDLQTLRPSDLQTLRLSDLQTLRLSDLQTLRLSDLQTFRPSDPQTFRPSDPQTLRPSFPHYKLKPAAMNILKDDLRVITQVFPQLGNIDIHASGSEVIIGAPDLPECRLPADQRVG